MSEDPFIERLRKEARHLRYEPSDDALWSRLSARIHASVASAPPSVAELLSQWMRPIAATVSALALAGVVAIATLTGEEDPVTLSNGGAQITVAGDSYSVGD
jgi:hypothetical protein